MASEFRRRSRARRTADGKIPAVGYVRVSTGEQARDGGSLEEQRAALLFHALANGLELVDVLEDPGISGAKDETKRPGLAAALKAIEDGRARVLLVRDLSRLARDTDLIGFLRVTVRRLGGELKVIGESEDTMYRFFDGLKAQMVRQAASDRMKLWAESRKRAGLPMGPAAKTPPEVIERMVAMRAAGVSIRGVAAALNEGGVPAPRGGQWSAGSVAAVLRRVK